MKYYRCKNYELLEKRLKVGDRVKIISSEKANSIMSLGYMFVFGFVMFKNCGKEFTIRDKMIIDVRDQNIGIDNVVAFRLNDSGFLYCIEMFDLTGIPALLENE